MSAIQHVIKTVAGTLLEFLSPGTVQDIKSGRRSGKSLRAKRWILYARTVRAKWRGDTAKLQASLFSSWQTDAADAFYDRYLDRYQKWFLGPHHAIVDELAKLATTGRYTRMVEIGCGAGRVLEHCASVMPDVAHFTGVDINAAIIARNAAQFSDNPRLEFIVANAAEWLETSKEAGTILMTYGVMEYFSAETLAAMFQSLHTQKPAAVVLVEPVDEKHDLDNNPASYVFGTENSFSHNHARLLRDAGYHIRFAKGVITGRHRWQLIVATTDAPV